MFRSRFRLSLCLAVLAITLGSLGVRTVGPTAVAAEPQANTRALERVMAVQDRNTNRLMAIQGVVGTAAGHNAKGQPVVKVFAAQAGLRGIPRNLEGVPVMVEVTGEFFALKPPSGKGKPPKDEDPKVDPTARFPRPVPIGVSTGHPSITAGTIGVRVTDGIDVYALSNNHVYADCNNASPGDNVLQPGRVDGGDPDTDAIGTLVDYEPIDFTGAINVIDAAIAHSSTDVLDNATPSDGYGVPKSATVDAKLRQKVKKYGRTTGATKGFVDGINGAFYVNYGDVDGDGADDRAYFEGQIVVKPGNFSAGGDSGSLVVTQRGNNPVGLLFAGSAVSTICSPIDVVLDTFSDFDPDSPVIMTIDGQ